MIDHASKSPSISYSAKDAEKTNPTWATYEDRGSLISPKQELKSPSILPWPRFDTAVAEEKLPNVSWMYLPGAARSFPNILLTKKRLAADNQTEKPVVRRPRPRTGPEQALRTSVIFITWDDWGGWDNQVDPPLRDKSTGGGPAKRPQLHQQCNSTVQLEPPAKNSGSRPTGCSSRQAQMSDKVPSEWSPAIAPQSASNP
jgi:hypothetical protein